MCASEEYFVATEKAGTIYIKWIVNWIRLFFLWNNFFVRVGKHLELILVILAGEEIILFNCNQAL